MAKQIIAQRTREIISYARTALGDQEYKLFLTEDELFDSLNECINEICRETHCVIKPDVVFDLVPNQVEYQTIDLVDTPQNILQVHGITIISPDLSESLSLIKITRADMASKRASSTSLAFPKYYNFDGETIYIFKPYAVTGYRIRLKASRQPTINERAGYESDPATPLKYDDYLKYGVVYRAGNRKTELLEKINFPFFQAEYQKYMRAKVKPFSVEAEKIDFNELRSYKQ